LAASVCLIGSGVLLFSCSNLNGPTAVSVDQGSPTTASVNNPWFEADIGSTGASQSAFGTKNLFVVYGSGADIQGTADAFHFVYRTLNGNGQLIMAPQTLTNVNGSNPNAWAKAGLMIREDLTPGSKNMLVAITPGNGVTSQYRSATNGSTSWVGGNGEKVPYYLKIVKNGNSITTYKSANGNTWTTIQTQTISMAATVYIGMAVCSHAAGTLSTSNFMMLTPAVITTQPQNTGICVNTTVGVSFKDDMYGLPNSPYSYQWYFSLTSSGTFAPISNGAYYSGANSFYLNITGIPGRSGTYGYYYCKINYLGMITQTNTISVYQASGC
jgi:regulation of enolase protein 1 (concanavalin A-like superfamily)